MLNSDEWQDQSYRFQHSYKTYSWNYSLLYCCHPTTVALLFLTLIYICIRACCLLVVNNEVTSINPSSKIISISFPQSYRHFIPSPRCTNDPNQWPRIRPSEQMLTGCWNLSPVSLLLVITINLLSFPHCKQIWAEITLISEFVLSTDLPEITDSFQLSWSLKYSFRRQFSLFSSDSFLLSDSPAGSFSVLDVRLRRPSRRRFREERASFAWKLRSHLKRRACQIQLH